MEKRVQDPLTVIRSDPVCKEQEIRRVLGRVYAILLDLAEKDTADSGDTAANQAPESADAKTSTSEEIAQ